jgi:large subunit ribosomal protein L32
MAVPKHKVSKSRRDSRKANFKATPATLTECAQCHTPIAPHRVCKNCGNYKGTKRIETKSDKKKEKKKDA